MDLNSILKHQRFKGATAKDLHRVVDTNDKKRFTIVTDENGIERIKANQGHSVEVHKYFEFQSNSSSYKSKTAFRYFQYSSVKACDRNMMQTRVVCSSQTFHLQFITLLYTIHKMTLPMCRSKVEQKAVAI